MNKDLFPVTAGDYIENTISRGKQSENSWSFKSKEALIEYFNLDKTFRDKLENFDHTFFSTISPLIFL